VHARIAQLPSRIVSTDGSLIVMAPSAALAYRAPVLSFIERTRYDLMHAVHLDARPLTHPMIVALGDDTNDTRVISMRATDSFSGEYTRVEVPDPEHADLDLFRAVLVRAFIHEWMLSARPAKSTAPVTLPPSWLIDGLARHMGSSRQMDVEAMHWPWLRGQIPPPSALLMNEPPVIMQDPALRHVVCAWILEHSENVMASLLMRLATGEAWTPLLVAQCLRNNGTLSDMDEDWEAWQTSAVYASRQPGQTSPGVVRAFRAQVLIYPGDYDIPMTDAWRGRTFEECLDLPLTPSLHAALLDKATRLQMFAAGRDVTLQGVASAYARFLTAFAGGESREQARRLLALAEEELAALEKRATNGEVLHDKPLESSKPSNSNSH